MANYLPVQKYCGSDYDCFQTCKRNKNGTCGGGSNIKGQTYYTTLSNQKNLWGTWTDGQNVDGKMLLNNGMYLSVHMRGNTSSDPIKNFFLTDKKSVEALSGYRRGFIWANYIKVDINGTKGPNRYGYDVFSFILDDNGLTFPRNDDKIFCDKSGNSLSSGSLYYSGMSCYAWVLKHNNMDYKYRNVSSQW